MDEPRKNLRSRVNFVPQKLLEHDVIKSEGLVPDNIILKSALTENAWINEATSKIGDWRSTVRTVYLRWAITINACFLAKERYEEMPAGKILQTSSLRIVDGNPQVAVVAQWGGAEAAENYERTTPLLSAHGLVEIYGAFEDILFELYEIFLKHNPMPIMEGPEFRKLRSLWRRRQESPEALKGWDAAWHSRFNHWRRNRAYDGLHRVFTSLYQQAKLSRPSAYKHTDINDWARSIEFFGELRNLIVHGSPVVSERLSELSVGSLTEFHAGEELSPELMHLQAAECFFNQLLTAINLSLVEAAQ